MNQVDITAAIEDVLDAAVALTAHCKSCLMNDAEDIVHDDDCLTNHDNDCAVYQFMPDLDDNWGECDCECATCTCQREYVITLRNAVRFLYEAIGETAIGDGVARSGDCAVSPSGSEARAAGPESGGDSLLDTDNRPHLPCDCELS